MQRVLAKELLGDRIVIADLQGQVVAMSGTCPHRGSALSLGWVNRGETAVTCRYHGFEWVRRERFIEFPPSMSPGSRSRAERTGATMSIRRS
jgi:phenylpropionate dioxygenase-like ring-hydroxylating dioxygenase large terminal subunit